MKGVIFNLLEEVVVTAHGDRAWDDLLTIAALCDELGVTRAAGL